VCPARSFRIPPGYAVQFGVNQRNQAAYYPGSRIHKRARMGGEEVSLRSSQSLSGFLVATSYNLLPAFW